MNDVSTLPAPAALHTRGLMPVLAGQFWIRREEGPWPGTERALVLDVRDGWVKYTFGPKAMAGAGCARRVDDFREKFDYAGDEMQKSEDEKLRERFERYCIGHNISVVKSARPLYEGQYAENYTQIAWGAFIAGHRGEYA